MTKLKSVPYIIAGVLIAIVVIVVLGRRALNVGTHTLGQPSGSTSAPLESTNPSGAGTTGTSAGYTLAQVKIHHTESDCWAAIDGEVYNLTPWIRQRSGGAEAILSLCGTDGSAAFAAQHGGQGRPEQELATLKVGTLIQ